VGYWLPSAPTHPSNRARGAGGSAGAGLTESGTPWAASTTDRAEEFSALTTAEDIALSARNSFDGPMMTVRSLSLRRDNGRRIGSTGS
jgi:hypothetical protein